MGGRDREWAADELLAHTGWLRRLALRLVGDADAADDLVQETWFAAVRRSPEAGDSLRPWLAKVLRDAFRMRARGEGRRAAREHAVSMVTDEVPTPEAMVAKAEAQRRLVDLLLELEEPYRSVVLLHYCEGISLADIARSQGIPAGTVRWRARVAVQKLRARLDADASGRRRRAVMLLAIPKGVLVAQKTSTATLGLLVLVLVVAGGIIGAFVGGAPSGTGGGEAAGSGPPEGRAGSLFASGGMPRRADEEPRLPAWLGQRDVTARRIAGRVTTHEGAPVEGASVTLASPATSGGAARPPRRVTNAAGEFDFGPQMATTYTVHASAPAMTGAARRVDLRDPLARPAPDELELRLGACDAAMVGTVNDASGGPIEGARVSWRRAGRSDLRSAERPIAGAGVTTDARGEYELCVDRGRVGVAAEVSADGYGAVVVRANVWGRQRFDFSLVPEATVVGRVLLEGTDEPVARARVRLRPGEWGLQRPARRGAFTDADGRFRITGVAPGPHLLDAFADGLASAKRTPILVEAGQTTREIEIHLEARSTVRGTVRDGDEPVAGAVITARTSVPGRRSAAAVSQKDGSFVLDRVPRGDVRFVARHHDVIRPETFRVDRAVHEGVALEVAPRGILEGRVVHDDRPVRGAIVELHGPNAGALEPTRTDADGRFEARGLRAGTWAAFASSDRLGAFGRAQDVELERGESAEVTIDLSYGATISGVVVDQEGAPVPGKAVAFHHDSRDDVGLATTSTDGSFRAAMMIGGGRYRPTVRPRARSASKLEPASGDEFPAVTLDDGTSEVTGVRLVVRLDRLSIAGQVVDETGSPVPDARVAAERIEAVGEPVFGPWFHQTSTITDMDGRFSLENLSAGTYALQARASSRAAAVARGVVAGRGDVSLVLPSPGTIEGSLVGFETTPRVFAVSQDAPGASGLVQASVSGDSFRLAPLSPGTYVVTAQTGTEATTERVEVAAGATARATLTSAGSGTVAGRVVEFHSGDPVKGMQCSAWPRAGNDRAGRGIGEGVWTDRDGAFELPAVPAGDIAIACRGEAHLYTHGLRRITVTPSQHLEIEVPVVKIGEDVGMDLADIGAAFDFYALVARLDRVRHEGPAAEAGFRDGDVVIAVGGEPVTELSRLSIWFLVARHPPGTRVEMTVRRGAETVTGTMVLAPNGGW